MSPRRNWDSPNPSPASECALPQVQRVGGGHTRLRLRGWGSPNSDDWRISLALYLLCTLTDTQPHSHPNIPRPSKRHQLKPIHTEPYTDNLRVIKRRL